MENSKMNEEIEKIVHELSENEEEMNDELKVAMWKLEAAKFIMQDEFNKAIDCINAIEQSWYFQEE